MEEEPLVFLSYTSADREQVSEVANKLLASKIDAWIDYRRIKPGQNWDFEIRKALDRSAIIVIFISENSVKKTGYVQRELKLALEKAEEKLVEDIYLIPVLLDDVTTIPAQLRDRHFVRHSDDNFTENLIGAISSQLEKRGIELSEAQAAAEITWSGYRFFERRDGAPGYEAEMRLFRLNSDVYPQISQIGDHIKGHLLDYIFEFRAQILEADAPFFNYGQDRWRRTHTIDLQSSGPIVHGRFISLVYAVHTYYAGAAHPNVGFRTFNFFMDPLFSIDMLQQLFEDADGAFSITQAEARRQLLEAREGVEFALDEDVVNLGTENWDDFKSFTFNENGIELLFAPYAVASYSEGPQFVEIKYDLVKHLLKPAFRSALDLEY